MIDSGLQRLNMVESQVRTSDVTDRRIIKAMLEVPREMFVPSAMASIAYMDEPVPVTAKANGGGFPRQLLAPRTLAKLVQLAKVEEGSAVLDVGCATGYSTAVLARIAKRVVALECDGALADLAAGALRTLGVDNAVLVRGPLDAGAAAEAPFDAIILNGAVPSIPQPLLDQLREGGRLVAIVVEGPLSRARVSLRAGSSFDTRPAFEAAAAPLPGFESAPGFVF
jgi:protein-L-isoaspartate(D-aspartate) O-methyltransferase